MRFSSSKIFTAAIYLFAGCLAGCTHASTPASENTLNGWEQYKFAMTPDQIRAIPGMTWFPVTTMDDGKISMLLSRTHFNRYGIDFGETILTFGADLKLTRIALRYAEVGKSPEDCMKQFGNLFPILEKNYGVFVPAVPPNNIHLGVGSPTVWRDVPGSKSQYDYDTMQIGDDTVSFANAKHMIGAGNVEVRMTAAEKRKNCSIDVNLQES